MIVEPTPILADRPAHDFPIARRHDSMDSIA